MLREMKSVTVTAKGQIAIPKSIRDKLENQKLALLVYDDRIELRPFQNVSEAMETALLSESSLAKEWNTPQEDEAWKDL